ncbi:hypothetical protein CNY67_02925 [Desulfovibrio sp. G11]|nr:hypothetical protein CNY67_02925 [Desulfovibrio sp. G11]
MLLEYGGGETYTWWGGLSANFNRFDPFILKFDFMYGNKQGNGMYRDETYTKDNGKVKKLGKHGPLDADRYNRSGWFASILAEYRFDWGTPGIFAWYSSGDDDDLNNGSERMPAMSGNWEYTHTGFKGTTASGAYDGIFAYQPLGLWGLALQLREIPLMEDLTSHIKVLYMRGTNSANMPKKIAESQYLLKENINGISPAGAIGSYLTTNDWAMEVDWNTEYKIYENLKLVVEASYLYVDFDKDTWSYTAPDGVKYGPNGRSAPTTPTCSRWASTSTIRSSILPGLSAFPAARHCSPSYAKIRGALHLAGEGQGRRVQTWRTREASLDSRCKELQYNEYLHS